MFSCGFVYVIPDFEHLKAANCLKPQANVITSQLACCYSACGFLVSYFLGFQ